MEKLVEKSQKKAPEAVKHYTFDEAYTACLEYFSGDPLPADVVTDKYLLRDEQDRYVELTPHDMHDRLAGEFARIDAENYGLDYNERFRVYREVQDLFSRIIVQGSPMSAIANPYQTMSASNCMVIESPDDSIAGIMSAGTELAQLCKRRAGVGLDISPLRPEGMRVNNAARTTSGCWSFADFYSYVTRMIAQRGRRGALIVTLDVHHPDVEMFATMKADLKKVTGANVSIKLTDEFLQAVEDDVEYEQRWPCEGEPVITRMVSAKQVWDTIIENACKCAEPGLLFWDQHKRRLPAHCYPNFRLKSVNPCVTSDTWIMTAHGPRQVKDLIGKKFIAYTDGGAHFSTEDGFFLTGKKKIFEIETNNGFKLKCTGNHRILKVTKKTQHKLHTEWTALQDLKKDDLVCLSNFRSILDKPINWSGLGGEEEGYLIGSLLGDGTFSGFKEATETRNPTAELHFWGKNKVYMRNKAASMVKNALGGRSDIGCGGVGSVNALKYDKLVLSVKLKKAADLWGLGRDKNLKSNIIEKASSAFYRGLLAGWFDADGSVQGDQLKGVSLRITSNNMNNLQVGQRMLARLGIISSIYKNRKDAGYKSLPDGKGGYKEYYCKATHEIVISNDNIRIFEERIGILDPDKIEELQNRFLGYKRTPNRERFVDKIINIQELGEELVYDCTIPSAHQFDANGLVVHNCGELPLGAYGSCRLISINLTSYVRKPFTEDAFFDFDLYKQDVRTAMQMIDNLVDIELELVTAIKDICSDPEEKALWQKFWDAGYRGRRTGLGTHGLADMLAQLTIRYDSQEALDFLNEHYEIHRNTAYEASIDLAEARGAFPDFDWELEKNNEYIQDLPDYLKERMAKVGRRNISILTQAPTGSVSLISKCGKFNRHNLSSGIEPVFEKHYKRRKKINDNHESARVDFVDESGDKWQEYEVYHGNILNYIEEVHGETIGDLTTTETQDRLAELYKDLPDYFISADEIDWEKRVRLQGVLQRNLDHSIASTINLPKGTEPELVGKIYFEAWKQGLKGITVYVKGSRDGVLITEDELSVDPTVRPEKVIRMMAPKRPKELVCDIHHHQVKGEKWIALVGLLNGEPYEMFGGYSSVLSLPKKYKQGKIIKRAKGKYSLHTGDGDDELIIQDVIGTFNTPELAWVTRLVSAALRHGTPIVFLCEQLSREGSINSFNKLLARVLKKYIPDGEKVFSSVKCEGKDGKGCDNPDLRYAEGCISCRNCGWYRCG